MLNSPFGHPAWIEIDLFQFKQNINIIKSYLDKTLLCLPVKANAYGHGLIPIAHAACEAGVNYLAVSCLQEGALLRHAGLKIPILVLGAIHQEQISELIEYDLEFTISSLYKAKMVAEFCKPLQKKVKVHLEVDTGMQRTGIRPETLPLLIEFLDQDSCFELTGIYTHFANSDDPLHYSVQQQIDIFNNLIEQYVKIRKDKVICHMANSGGMAHFPESFLDMVRPGILTFGHYPNTTKILTEIKACFTLKAKISYVKTVAKGQGVSYGHRYKTNADSRIITIPLGYGDGLPRALSNKADILLNGKRYPIAGTICMDQFMVDITNDPAYVGDIVTILGKDGEEEITINEIAALSDTITYEILCGFNNRLPRLYHTEKDSFWEKHGFLINPK